MIRLTRLTDYGIVLMSHLAVHGDRRWNAADLAADTKLPAPTVSKILKLLVRADLLDSHRGVKGGYSLARSSSDISVVDIIDALDGPIALTECSDESGDDCSYEADCRVKTNWQRINQVVKEALSQVTLEEMSARVPGVMLGGGQGLITLGR